MALRWVRVSGPDIKVRGSFFLTVTVVWKGGDIATIRERSGSEERSWGDRVRVAKAEREEGSLPVMVEWGHEKNGGASRFLRGRKISLLINITNLSQK